MKNVKLFEQFINEDNESFYHWNTKAFPKHPKTREENAKAFLGFCKSYKILFVKIEEICLGTNHSKYSIDLLASHKKLSKISKFSSMYGLSDSNWVRIREIGYEKNSHWLQEFADDYFLEGISLEYGKKFTEVSGKLIIDTYPGIVFVDKNEDIITDTTIIKIKPISIGKSF